MRRALLSVWDKKGIEAFAGALVGLGFEIVSTGGTFRALKAAGIPARYVSEITGFPEILAGRIKTLHPRIHAGILAERKEAHLDELQGHEIEPIDLVAVNLYPFREAAAGGASFEEVIEQIDIGGSAMLRAAAKNHAAVLPVCDPADYQGILQALRGDVHLEFRRALARKAFAHTAAYDAAIAGWFDDGALLPPTLHVTLERAQNLRYGENPHQQGARYRETGRQSWWDEVSQHGGLELSYLNLLDAEAAWRLVCELKGPAAVIVKHANPCGVALADDIATAYARAHACDPKSAFGGIVALNRVVTTELAQEIVKNPKADVLIAPAFEAEALELFARRRKNMRVLEAPLPRPERIELRPIGEGFLVQERDHVSIDRADWRVVTKSSPSEAQWRDLELAWQVCAYTKSNAIVFVADGQAVGIGAGQQSRVDAVEIAARKAAGRAKGGACASDAFFPFRDGIDAASAAGVAAIIQPGGSLRDDEIIAAADEHAMAMIFTGRRHFKH